MAMEALFAEYAGFELGDVFILGFPRGEYKCVLSALVSSPEWEITYRDAYFDFSTDEFGYVLFSYADLLEMTGLPYGTYNQVMVRTQPDIDASAVQQQLLDSGLFGKGAYGYIYETSPQKGFLDSCVNPLKQLSYYLAFFLFLISALMVYLFLYQIIWEQKEESGILMALGASRIRIAGVYLVLGIGVSVMAGLTGSLLGYFLMKFTSQTYQEVFLLPYMVEIFSPGLALAASLMMTLVIVCSFLFASIQIFRMDPADAMRNQMAQSRGKPSWKILSIFGYAAKVCFCSALRNKRRLILSMFSTILAVTMISLSFQYIDAGKHVEEHTFQEWLLYDCQIFLNNVHTNVALAADMAKAPRPVEEVLEMMGLSHRKDHYPSQLSGGEQQRVSIARALVKNAAFLLCDEPTGALDYNTGKQILIELEKLAREQGQTVVIVTHTTSISTIADRILKMRSGRIVEEIVNPHPVSAATVEW